MSCDECQRIGNISRRQEEEDYKPKGEEETSCDEEEVALREGVDMHMEFILWSVDDNAKKPKIKFIPFHILEENKQELFKKILVLGQEIDDLKEENSILKHKLRKKGKISTPSTTSSPPPKKEI